MRQAATLPALAQPAGDGGWIVKSPGVGIYRDGPRVGSHRGSGDAVGRLAILTRSIAVVLPAGAEGFVVSVAARDRAVPVEYGQALFHLSPSPATSARDLPVGPPRAQAGRSPHAGEAPVPDGCHAVTCPIDGVFYRRPSPAAPPFVEPGDVVQAGRTLGLIEAMKSFNAVAYEGAGLPERAVIVEARAGDAAEVRQGAVLFVVRSAP